MNQSTITGISPLEAIADDPNTVRAIEQPFNDHRLRIERTYIGCANKKNADLIMALQEQALRVRRLEAALAHIAFGDSSELAGNPMLWPSTIAYVALGGRYEDGRKMDMLEDLLPGLALKGDV